MSFPPSLSVSYTDQTSANTIFPAVANYEDGRLLALVLGLAFSATALLIYLAGMCPAAAARFDACSSESYIVGALNSAAFRSAPRTSRFGGMMTLAAGVVAIAVCIDVAVQYSLPGGGSFDSTSLAPPLVPLPPKLTAGRVDVTLVARAANPTTACLLVAILTEGKAQGAWKLTRASSSTGLVNGSSTPVPLCTFALNAPAFALQLPHFAASPEPATARFTLGLDLQIVRWTVAVADAKDGAATTASPSGDVRGWWGYVAASDAAGRNLTAAEAIATLVPTAMRAHTVGVRLLRSAFVDRTYFSVSGGADDGAAGEFGGGGGGGATSYGHKASFLSYAVEDNSPTASGPGLPALRGDTLLLSFSLADLVSTTVRVPRFGILPLLGVIGGLALAVAAVFKLLYEYADACCSCARIEKERVKARILRGEKVDLAPAPRGKLLLASSSPLSSSPGQHETVPPQPHFPGPAQPFSEPDAAHHQYRNPMQSAAPLGARFRQSLRLFAYAPVAVGGTASASGAGRGDADGGGKGGAAVPVLGSRVTPLIPGSSLNASAQAISPEQLPETTNPFFRGGIGGGGAGAGAVDGAAAGGAKRPGSSKAPPPGTKKAVPVFSLDGADSAATTVTTTTPAEVADVGLESTAAGV